MDSTGALISWAGGYILDEIGPGLAFSRPYNDEVELGGESEFITFEAGSDEAEAEAVARWVISRDAEVCAAISLEDFDPRDTLDARDEAAWDRAMSDMELGLSAYGYGLLRQKLAELSDLYCATRDALADPSGELGQSLLQAYGSGGPYPVRNGDWTA